MQIQQINFIQSNTNYNTPRCKVVCFRSKLKNNEINAAKKIISSMAVVLCSATSFIKIFQTKRKNADSCFIQSQAASRDNPTVNFEKLDKEKKYICLQYGHGKQSRKIIRRTKNYCDSSNEVPVHVACFANESDSWFVYESHMDKNKLFDKSNGTHKLNASEWLQKGKNSRAKCEIYELDINTNQLEQNLEKKYGYGDIVKLFLASIFYKNGKQSDSPGYTCSEFIATGFVDICIFYKIPPWCITPAHFKDYLVKNHILSLDI